MVKYDICHLRISEIVHLHQLQMLLNFWNSLASLLMNFLTRNIVFELVIYKYVNAQRKICLPRWYRVSCLYPTIGIHHFTVLFLYRIFKYAINGITDVLTHQGQRRWTQKDHARDFIMQSKHIIINTDRIKL